MQYASDYSNKWNRSKNAKSTVKQPDIRNSNRHSDEKATFTEMAMFTEKATLTETKEQELTEINHAKIISNKAILLFMKGFCENISKLIF